ncbi:MAG: LysR family transcriptional regulator [Caulobacter sp.]|nr:LysR family transcriptional regulator [Caulobacter sp.]
MSQRPTSPTDWEGQRAFLAVLETGSLSGAARRLQMAQPTVRRRIEDLEAALGAALFTRSPAGLTPTSTALQLGDHARAMAAAADAFNRTASAEAAAETGTVRVTASEIIAVEVLPDIIARMQQAHPGLVIELGVSNRNEDLLRREADIAVRMAPPRQEALLARRIGEIPLGLHGHRRLIERYGMPASLEAIRTLPFVGFERETPFIEVLRNQGVDVRRENFTFRTDNDAAMLAAIRAGVGFGVCQVALARRTPDLVPVLENAFRFGLETWIVMHEDLKGSRRMRLVFDALVQGMADYLRDGAANPGSPLA